MTVPGPILTPVSLMMDLVAFLVAAAHQLHLHLFLSSVPNRPI